MNDKKYTIDQLGELTGYKRRTIRYYIQEGILEPPAGRGRGGFYNDSHLDKLAQIKALREKGLGLSEIVPYLRASETAETSPVREVWAKYEVVPGLEINVSRQLEEEQGKKISRLLKIAGTLMKEDSTDD